MIVAYSEVKKNVILWFYKIPTKKKLGYKFNIGRGVVDSENLRHSRWELLGIIKILCSEEQIFWRIHTKIHKNPQNFENLKKFPKFQEISKNLNDKTFWEFWGFWNFVHPKEDRRVDNPRHRNRLRVQYH